MGWANGNGVTMALKYKLDAEAFESLDEAVKGSYKQEGNVYILDVEGLDTGNEDLTGLKAKVDQLLTEKKEAERKAREEADRARQKADEDAKAKGDYEQLYKSQKEEAERLRQEHEKLQQAIRQSSIQSEAARMAGSLTRDTARAEILAEKIAGRLSLTDDGIKVTDGSGQLTVSSLDELTHQIKTAYPFLVDGSQASGGAAQGSKGGAEGSAKQISRSQWDGMDHADRANFAREGGKVTDD